MDNHQYSYCIYRHHFTYCTSNLNLYKYFPRAFQLLQDLLKVMKFLNLLKLFLLQDFHPKSYHQFPLCSLGTPIFGARTNQFPPNVIGQQSNPKGKLLILRRSKNQHFDSLSQNRRLNQEVACCQQQFEQNSYCLLPQDLKDHQFNFPYPSLYQQIKC